MKALFVLLLACTGCRVGPVYQAPDSPSPAEWKGKVAAVPYVPSVDYWWEVFGDEMLNDLEQQAVANNPSLQQAWDKVFEARATAGIARADLYPQINLNPLYTNTGTLFQLNGVPTGMIPGLKPIVRIHTFEYFLPATLTYEVDIWGKYRGIYESAVYNAQAEEDAYRATLLSLTADLASHYFNLRTLDAQILLLEETIKLRADSLKLTRSRYKGGISGVIDVSSAELELANTEAQYFDTVRQRRLFENAIATLIGIPASDFCLASNPLVNHPPQIPPGVPSSILVQRPDIAQAERIMASQHSQIGVAYASLLPSLSLTATVGYFSPTLKDFLTWKSRYWQYGASGSQFIFDAGKRGSELAVAWARFWQADDRYRQVVLTAFQEVEDSLNSLDQEARQFDSLQKSVTAAGLTLKSANRRYLNGIVAYYEVIESQRSDLTAKLNLLNVLDLRYQATIALIKALGGGWGC